MYAGQVKRERASVGKLSAVHCQWKACLSGRPTFLNKQKRKWVPFLFVTQQEWDCAERGAAGWKKSRKARVSKPLFELLPPRLFLRDRLFQSLPLSSSVSLPISVNLLSYSLSFHSRQRSTRPTEWGYRASVRLAHTHGLAQRSNARPFNRTKSFTTRRDCFNVRVVISDTLESIKVPLMLWFNTINKSTWLCRPHAVPPFCDRAYLRGCPFLLIIGQRAAGGAWLLSCQGNKQWSVGRVDGSHA